MAIMKKYALQEQYVQIPNATAKSVEGKKEETISLQALGLIVNLWSYNVEKWELHKTELYRRYGHNRETSVKNAWNELIEFKYIVQFKYRVGKSWEYVYVYRVEPFSDEEIAEIYKESEQEYGKIWGLDFQDLKMETSKCGLQNHDISNTIPTKDSNNEIPMKENLNPNPMSEKENYDKPEPPKENKTTVADIESAIWDLEIPQGLKIRIKTALQNKSIYNLSIKEILEIEDAYNFQLQNMAIISDCDDSDLYSLNEKQFINTVMKMLESMKGQKIDSIRALIDSWIKTGLKYLQEDQYVLSGYQPKENSIYFNWLNAEE